MPYIAGCKREYFEVKNVPQDAGELNYAITALINDYMFTYAEKNYRLINECIGVLECAKLELYRRVAAPYEDIKKEENGDVY